MRLLWCLLLVPASFGCAGFSTVERGEWRRVYTEDVAGVRRLDAKQEVITREKWEEELAHDVRRTWEPMPGFEAPFLADLDRIGLAVGEVMQFRVDEGQETELQLNGHAVQVYQGPVVKRDEWKNGSDVTRRESTLYLVGQKPGTAVLRLVLPQESKDIPVTVK
jgi:hypothetical protein